MSGDRFDYSSERARHENFVGRTGLLARLDQLLVEDAADRWVVITGGPGMGKSALLAAWMARRVAARAVVPHHFIRRGLYDWDRHRQRRRDRRAASPRGTAGIAPSLAALRDAIRIAAWSTSRLALLASVIAEVLLWCLHVSQARSVADVISAGRFFVCGFLRDFT